MGSSKEADAVPDDTVTIIGPGPRTQSTKRASALRSTLYVLVAAFAIGFAVAISPNSLRVAYIYAALAGVGAIALTVLQGWAGQGSLLVAGLYLVGGYCAAAIPASLGSAGVILGIGLAMLAGAGFGVLCSLPANRLTGVYLLLGTLALQYVVNDGGNIFQSDRAALGGFGVSAALLTQNEWLAVTFTFLLAALTYFRSVGRSRVGRAAVLIRNDPGLAQVSGINTTSYIRWVFVITSIFMAVAGAVETYYTTTVSYDAYGVTLSVQFLVMIVVLGLGSLWGAVGGAFFVIVLTQFLSQTLAGGSGIYGSVAYVVGLIYGAAGFLAVVFLSRTGNPAPVRSRSGMSAAGPQLAVRKLLLNKPQGRHDERRTTAERLNLAGSGGEEPGVVSLVIRRIGQDFGHGRGVGATSIDGQLVGAELHNVTIRYGGAEAVAGVSLSIPTARTAALVGRNGAGKTSLLLSVVGFPRDSRGRLSRESRVSLTSGEQRVEITHLAASQRSRLGISFVPADGKVFPSLTVDEHIALSAKQAKRRPREVEEYLEVFADLQMARSRQAGLLSGGQKQQLALLCALAGSPRLLVVDELTLGLSPSATERVLDALVAVRSEAQLALLLAEQSVGVAFELADEVALMENGQLVSHGPPTPAFEALVRRAYVGVAEFV